MQGDSSYLIGLDEDNFVAGRTKMGGTEFFICNKKFDFARQMENISRSTQPHLLCLLFDDSYQHEKNKIMD